MRRWEISVEEDMSEATAQEILEEFEELLAKRGLSLNASETEEF